MVIQQQNTINILYFKTSVNDKKDRNPTNKRNSSGKTTTTTKKKNSLEIMILLNLIYNSPHNYYKNKYYS